MNYTILNLNHELFLHIPNHLCTLVYNLFILPLTTYFALVQDGILSDDASPSPFLPSPSLKLPLANSSLPGQGLGQGNPGLAMQNLNNRQQVTQLYYKMTQKPICESFNVHVNIEFNCLDCMSF